MVDVLVKQPKTAGVFQKVSGHIKVAGRDKTVDTLRGIACILLVLVHVHTGISFKSKIPTGEIWENSMHLLFYLRMPLFTFLSGVVYARRPFTSGAIHFLQGKARRILLPMIFVGAAYAFMRIQFVGLSYDSLTLMHIKPFEYLWYLESLFIIFVFVVVAEKIGILSKLVPYSVSFAVLAYLYILDVDVPVWFGLSNAFYLLPFFLVGVGYTRFFASWIEKTSVASIRVFFVAYCLVWGLFLWGEGTTRMSPLFLFSCSLCLLAIGLNMHSSVLSRLGRYSYSIYLFHPFLIFPVRKNLIAMGVESVATHIILGLSVGLIGPIILHRIFNKSPLSATFFLGVRFRKKKVQKNKEIVLV